MSGLKVDFGVNAFQDVVTMNALSVPVMARSLSAPSCSVAQEDGAMDDSADIPSLAGVLCASMSGWIQRLSLGSRHREWVFRVL
jgi:hypothetical protein